MNNIKISLLQVYVTQYNCNITCLSETFLNSSIRSDNDRIKIGEYILIRSDHPSNSEKGGFCIFYKEYLFITKWDDICTLGNCLVTEICSQNETCSYRLPGESQDEFQNFCTNFDIIFSQINYELPICSIVTGDFICSWLWINDIAGFAGKEIDFLTSPTGLHKSFKNPLNDLIFCTNQNVISKYDADVSFFW